MDLDVLSLLEVDHQRASAITLLFQAGLRSRLPFFLFVCLFLFVFSWAASVAYGGSQARGPIGAVAAGLRQSHSNSRSELRLQPTPQLTATPDC